MHYVESLSSLLSLYFIVDQQQVVNSLCTHYSYIYFFAVFFCHLAMISLFWFFLCLDMNIESFSMNLKLYIGSTYPINFIIPHSLTETAHKFFDQHFSLFLCVWHLHMFRSFCFSCICFGMDIQSLVMDLKLYNALICPISLINLP